VIGEDTAVVGLGDEVSFWLAGLQISIASRLPRMPLFVM
jgi:hypothetical protein